VTLLTAHKILISTAVLFFFGISLWELRGYWDAGNGWALLRGLLYLAVAIGFGLYLRYLKYWLK